MEHYETLFKGLINGGGSSSEAYSSILLTGSFDRMIKLNTTIDEMWNYLDKPLQAVMIDVMIHCDAFAPQDREEYPSYFVERMARMSANAECSPLDECDETEKRREEIKSMILDRYYRG